MAERLLARRARVIAQPNTAGEQPPSFEALPARRTTRGLGSTWGAMVRCMFEGFARVWTPVAPVGRVKRRPLRLRLAGVDLVLFRGTDGAIGALLDHCPHRGASLSLGEVKPDGCLACPFHAWRFDPHGNATHVPLNPQAKRERLFAQALPVRVIGELVWVYTDPAAKEPPEPLVPEGLSSPSVTRTFLEVRWSAHWTRVMENMLDSPHVPFVHRATIGRTMQRWLTDSSRMDITWEETPYGGRSFMRLDSQPEAQALASLDFYRPNIMALHIPIPGKHFRMHALCVPVDANHVRLLVVGSRDFARSRLFNPLFNWANARIAAEDKAVVESSFPVEIPRPAEEVSVASDRATLQFRKYYFAQLADSSASPRPRGPSGSGLAEGT
jgi:phenylpropionate dioxygenase-like ring-hydroxylating dioxygenase large terminal subunit